MELLPTFSRISIVVFSTSSTFSQNGSHICSTYWIKKKLNHTLAIDSYLTLNIIKIIMLLVHPSWNAVKHL